MAKHVIGIDVSKLTLDVILTDGITSHFLQVDNTLQGYAQLDAWLKKWDGANAHACLEATGQYGDPAAEYLHFQGYQVSVVNPAQIKHYGQSKLRRNKTDKADAKLIAEYCLRETPAIWNPPSKSFKDLQALVRHLDDLQAMRLQESNRLGSGVHTAFVVASLNQLVTILDDQIQQTKQAIQDHIDQHPDLKHRQELLITIPGIAHLTAARLLGEIRDILSFENARQLSAYAGLTPRKFYSGTSVHRKARLSKAGNAKLRQTLYLPAISAKRWNPIVHAFCDRLIASNHSSMEVIGAAMHKLLHLVYGVLKSDRPFDPNYLGLPQVPP